MGLIRYAGWEAPTSKYHRNVPVERARELRQFGMSWKQVAERLTAEYRAEGLPFAADAVCGAVARARKKEGAR